MGYELPDALHRELDITAPLQDTLSNKCWIFYYIFKFKYVKREALNITESTGQTTNTN